MAIWFKSFANLRDHPKLFLFAAVLGVNDVEALGYIHLFLGFVCSYAEDGGLKKFPDSTIEKVCKWSGTSGQFVKALIDAGFVEETSEGRIVHDWWKENGGHIREAERKRQSRIMANRVRGQSEDEDGTVRLTDRQTDRQTDKQDGYHDIRERLDGARVRFIALRAEHPAYKGKTPYVWSERDRKAINAALYPDRLSGHYPSQEDVEHGLANFFASDPRFSADHSAFYFFERFNQFIAGPAVERGRQGLGGKDAKAGRPSRLSGFGADKKITGKGKGVKDIRWNDDENHDGAAGGRGAASSATGGSDAKV